MAASFPVEKKLGITARNFLLYSPRFLKLLEGLILEFLWATPSLHRPNFPTPNLESYELFCTFVLWFCKTQVYYPGTVTDHNPKLKIDEELCSGLLHDGAVQVWGNRGKDLCQLTWREIKLEWRGDRVGSLVVVRARSLGLQPGNKPIPSEEWLTTLNLTCTCNSIFKRPARGYFPTSSSTPATQLEARMAQGLPYQMAAFAFPSPVRGRSLRSF